MKAPIIHSLLLFGAVIAGTALGTHAVRASDHDDGTSDLKTVNTNLTDLFVFSEKTQIDGGALDGTNENVVMIMNLNPRSLPQQQYFFNTSAIYDFNVKRITGALDAAIPANTHSPDVIFRFEFGAPGNDNRQAITMTTLHFTSPTASTATVSTTATARVEIDGTDLTAGTIVTTPHPFQARLNEAADGQVGGIDRATYAADSACVNTVDVGGASCRVFAGLREDPFFFDVDKFFRVRASAARRLGGSVEPQVLFDNANAVDFTTGYNVLSIVLRVPRSLLQNGTAATAFDVWETIKVPV